MKTKILTPGPTHIGAIASNSLGETAIMEAGSLLPFDPSILAGQLAPSSIAMYTRDFATYLTFAGSTTAALDATTFARWRTWLAQSTELSPNTINRMLAATKRLMKEAAIQGYLTHEQAKAFAHIDGVKVSALKNRLSVNARTRIEPEGVRAMANAAETERVIGLRNAALLHTAASSALRVSELATLKRDQVIRRLHGYVVRVMGKNESEYVDTTLSAEAYDAIQTGSPHDPSTVTTSLPASTGEEKRVKEAVPQRSHFPTNLSGRS